jgi:hypothetical protein
MHSWLLESVAGFAYAGVVMLLTTASALFFQRPFMSAGEYLRLSFDAFCLGQLLAFFLGKNVWLGVLIFFLSVFFMQDLPLPGHTDDDNPEKENIWSFIKNEVFGDWEVFRDWIINTVFLLIGVCIVVGATLLSLSVH